MQRTLYSGHLSQPTTFLGPNSHYLCRADTLNNRQYKTFLVRNLYVFYFRQCFAALFKFSSIFVILFFSKINALFRSKIPYSPPQLTGFPVAKMSEAQWVRDRNMNTIMDISVAYDQPPLLYSEYQYQPLIQHYCANYHINMISSDAQLLSWFHDSVLIVSYICCFHKVFTQFTVILLMFAPVFLRGYPVSCEFSLSSNLNVPN